MSDGCKAKFKVNDPVFILDPEWGRVFPAIVTWVKDPDIWYTPYKVKLDETPGVHDELAFNGIAKPCPFMIPPDRTFHVSELFTSKTKAYHALLDQYDMERDNIKERLKRIPHLVKRTTELLNQENKASGCIYKLGDTVWFISSRYHEGGKITEATITKYDRGDFQDKPYEVTGKDCWQNIAWLPVDQIYATKEEAAEALKARIKAECDKRLAEVC